MPDEITYFGVAAFLADIEPDYERYLDPIEKKQRLVLAGREKWSSMTAHEAAAFVQLFLAGRSIRRVQTVLRGRFISKSKDPTVCQC